MNASVLSELLGFGSIIDFEKEDEGMEKEEMIERLTAFKNGWENPKTAMPDFWEEVIKALPSVEPDGKDINVTTTDAISRQAAIDAFNAFADEVNQDTDIHEAIEIIINLPPVNTAKKVGRWIKKEHEICFTCNQCWVTNASGVKYNYCPSCGSRMIQEVEG